MRLTREQVLAAWRAMTPENFPGPDGTHIPTWRTRLAAWREVHGGVLEWVCTALAVACLGMLDWLVEWIWGL